MEADLEAGFGFVVGKVGKTNINEVFESTRVTFGDGFRDAQVVTEGCKPKLWNCRRASRCTLGEWRVV